MKIYVSEGLIIGLTITDYGSSGAPQVVVGC